MKGNKREISRCLWRLEMTRHGCFITLPRFACQLKAVQLDESLRPLDVLGMRAANFGRWRGFDEEPIRPRPTFGLSLIPTRTPSGCCGTPP
jgi:hypothetical protein